MREVISNNKEDSHDKVKFKRIWTFLGEPFSLWILSSLLLGLITFMYTQWDNKKKEQIQDRILFSKLRLEILSRNSAAKKIIDFADNEHIMKYGINLLLLPPQDSGASVFLEYKQRSLKSILWESTLIDNMDKSKIDSLISKCEYFELYYYHNITIKKKLLRIIDIEKSSRVKVKFDKQKQELIDYIKHLDELYY